MIRQTDSLRADRLLAGLGYGSRKDVGILIHNEEFLVDGVAIRDPARKLTMQEARRATLCGEPLDPLPSLTILLHKPQGYICSRDDSGMLVYDLLPPRFARRSPSLSCAGRLDADSTGLVLLTDDGQLAHRITSPRTHLPKRYRATLEDPLRPETAETFAAGTLMLDGEKNPLKPVELTVIDPHTADLVLREGRYHQIRRMFAAVGNHVTALHRYRIGGLEAGDLAPGAWRALDERDIAALLTDVIR